MSKSVHGHNGPVASHVRARVWGIPGPGILSVLQGANKLSVLHADLKRCRAYLYVGSELHVMPSMFSLCSTLEQTSGVSGWNRGYSDRLNDVRGTGRLLSNRLRSTFWNERLGSFGVITKRGTFFTKSALLTANVDRTRRMDAGRGKLEVHLRILDTKPRNFYFGIEAYYTLTEVEVGAKESERNSTYGRALRRSHSSTREDARIAS